MLERQAKSVKNILNLINSNKNTALNQALDQLIKGSFIQIHNVVLLARENDQLCEAVN